MKEVIVRLTSDHIKVKGGEYVRDYQHGKWIPHKQENGKTVLWKCSECGQIIFSETETDRLEFHKWCSRCGADMREVRDE